HRRRRAGLPAAPLVAGRVDADGGPRTPHRLRAALLDRDRRHRRQEHDRHPRPAGAARARQAAGRPGGGPAHRRGAARRRLGHPDQPEEGRRMTAPFVIGVDPGGTTGIAVYDGLGDAELLQCTPGLVLPTVRTLLGVYEGAVRPGALLAVERFVVGTRAARSASARSGEIARELIGALADLGPTYGVRVVHRSEIGRAP